MHLKNLPYPNPNPNLYGRVDCGPHGLRPLGPLRPRIGQVPVPSADHPSGQVTST